MTTTTKTRKPSTRKSSAPPRDIYQEVTDKIVGALETCGEWERPWTNTVNGAGNPRSIDGRPYRGANVLLLWVSAIENSYSSGVWGTYKAWGRHGAQVRKGETGTMVTLWKSFDRKATAEEIASGAADKNGRIKSLVLRHFTVFAAEQVDGWEAPVVDTTGQPTPVEHAEQFFAKVGADVRTVAGIAAAYYMPSTDQITTDVLANYKTADSYYSTLAHEHGHWTGHTSRLDRNLTKRFDTAAVAMEELVAELTAAFVCAHLGIETEVRNDQHASYVKSWLKALRNDKRAVFTAASMAQKATDLILSLAGEAPAPKTEDDE